VLGNMAYIIVGAVLVWATSAVILRTRVLPRCGLELSWA
jgi:hypothetical protein